MDTGLLKMYHKGKIQFVNGQLQDALKSLQTAYDELKLLRDNFVWKTIYINCGSALALVLDYIGKFDEESDLYDELLQFSTNELYLGDYAIFLHRRKKDYKLADHYYTESLRLFPYQASIHLKYASFLRYIKNDLLEAEKHYQEAIRYNPNAETLGNYASYLHSSHHNEEAESYYKKALELDETHVNNLCNYGLLLSEENKNYVDAEYYYKLALKMSENNHPNTLYNYAVMLDTRLNRKTEAESYYRQAISIDNKHAYACYNLAVLLEDREMQLKRIKKLFITGGSSDNIITGDIHIDGTSTRSQNTEQNNTLMQSSSSSSSSKKNTTTTTTTATNTTTTATRILKDDYDENIYSMKGLNISEIQSLPVPDSHEISELFQQAMSADPRDASIAADCGRYLAKRLHEYEKAEEILHHTLTLDNTSEIALYHLAFIFHKRMKYHAAKDTVQKLLSLNSNHSMGLLLLARIRVDIYEGTLTNTVESSNKKDTKSTKSRIIDIIKTYEGAISLLKQPNNACQEFIAFVKKYGTESQIQQVEVFTTPYLIK